MKNLEKYLSCVAISIVLVFLFIIFGLLTFIKSYIISGDIFFDTLKSKDIYSKIYNSLDSYYQEQYNVTGIPKDVFMNTLNLDDIQIITDDITYHGINYIEGNPNSLLVTYNFESLKSSIDTFFNDYANSIGYHKDDVYYAKVSEVTQNTIDKITFECDVFNWNILKSSGILDRLSKYIPYIDYIQIGIGLASVVLIIVLIVLNGKHYIVDNIYWIGTSLSISSIIMLIPCIYLKSTNYFTSFAVKSEIIFNAVTGFLNTTLEKFISMWIVLLCIGIVLFLTGFILNLRKVH